jgi:hypothetical protein
MSLVATLSRQVETVIAFCAVEWKVFSGDKGFLKREH